MKSKRKAPATSAAIVQQPVGQLEPIIISDVPTNYVSFIESLKLRIQTARINASLSVNRELIALYWDIGKQILERQRVEGWGAKVVAQIAHDLLSAFPDMKGLSRANLLYMRAFAEAYPEAAIVQQVVGQIPWGHNLILIARIKDPSQRLWYAQQTIINGWSRAVLDAQIASDLFHRQGGAITNFDRTLPPPQSDLARQMLKDPMNFEFLTLGTEAKERELELGLLGHIQKTMMEFGRGFAFVNSQYHLEVDGEDFYLDLLFYNYILHCFFVVELKIENFKPEFVGKMDFYLTAVDAQLTGAADNPAIGLIVCKTRKKLIVEYALNRTRSPIGVTTWLTEIPAEYKSIIPSLAEFEAELSREPHGHDEPGEAEK